MKKSVLLIGLLSFLAASSYADGYDNPTVNSRLASSAQFPSENSFNNDGHSSSAPKKAKKKKKKKTTASKTAAQSSAKPAASAAK